MGAHMYVLIFLLNKVKQRQDGTMDGWNFVPRNTITHTSQGFIYLCVDYVW